MATIGEGSGSSNPNASSSASSHQAPKILLAKPSLVTTAKYNREAGGGGGGGGPDDASSSLRFRFPCLFAMSILLLLKIQEPLYLGVLLTSICHIILEVSKGVHDNNMWRLMATVDLLKHSIPDPSSLSLSHPQSSNLGSDKEVKDKIQEVGEEYMASPVFVHTKLHEQDVAPHYLVQLKKGLNQYFSSTSFNKQKHQNVDDGDSASASAAAPIKSFFIASKTNTDSLGTQHESYHSSLWNLRDQVLSMSSPSFSRTVSERDWLKNSGKIWELVKNSSTISDYCKTLQNSGLFRR